jgi:ankyrin repeat protein
MATLASVDPSAKALRKAIKSGDLHALQRLLDTDGGLAAAGLTGRKGSIRTPLHLVVDWPGYFPNGPEVARTLLDAGADPNAPIIGGRHPETPLHGAASNDDVDVAEVLIDGGADLEVTGACIAGGTALNNAVAFGCWHVARLLVGRGARVDHLWQAAGLGLLSRMEGFLGGTPAPSDEEVNDAFWQACHGGQFRAAARLLAAGAESDWTPSYSESTPLDIVVAPDTRRQELANWLRARGAEQKAM